MAQSMGLPVGAIVALLATGAALFAVGRIVSDIDSMHDEVCTFENTSMNS